MAEEKRPLAVHVCTYIEERRLAWFREDLYLYDAQRGIYTRAEESIVRQDLLGHLTNCLPPDQITAGLVTSALDLAKDLSALPGHLEPPFWRTGNKPTHVVVARNGIVDLEVDPVDGKWTLRPHDPDLFAIGGVDYDYSPEAMCPCFDGFLSQLTGNDPAVVDLILRFYAQAFTRNDYRAEAMLWLYGRGRNGKSVLCHVLRHVLGEPLTSAVDLQAFSSPASFRLWPLLHSTANFSFDAQLDHKTSITALNTWVSGDGVTIDRKYKRPITVRPKTLLTVASNREPLVDDRSDAFWRRIRPVQCPNQVSEDAVDCQFEKRLRAEAPGILNRLLAYVPIVEREPSMPVPPSTRKIINELRRQVGSFALFVADELERSADDHVGRDDLMEAFRSWCVRNCTAPVGIREVKAEMLRLFNATMHRCRKGHEGRRIDVWSGVRWRRDPDDDDNPVTERGLSRRPKRSLSEPGPRFLGKPESAEPHQGCRDQPSASVAASTPDPEPPRSSGHEDAHATDCHSAPSPQGSVIRQSDPPAPAAATTDDEEGLADLIARLSHDDDREPPRDRPVNDGASK